MLRICKICLEEKLLIENFPKAPSYKNTIYYRYYCHPCSYTKQINSFKKYRSTDTFKAKRRQYRKTIESLVKERKYENDKYHSDNLYRTTKRLRACLNSAIKAKGFNKRAKFWEYTGCGKQELIDHLENQFLPGMTWENHGQWHIDHKKALRNAKTEEELYKRGHYTNLQPLWAKDNQKKSNKE